MGSHSVICHVTAFIPGGAVITYMVIDLATPEGCKAELRWIVPRSLLTSAFLCSVISDSRRLSMSSQQLAADPLNDDDIELRHIAQRTKEAFPT